jgi:arginine and glutamate-rich protein 1
MQEEEKNKREELENIIAENNRKIEEAQRKLVSKALKHNLKNII